MKTFQMLLIIILTLTLPVTQAHAILPDSHSIMSELVNAVEGDGEGGYVTGPVVSGTDIPVGDLWQPSADISNVALDESVLIDVDAASLEEAVSAIDGELAEDLVAPEQDGFWSRRKILGTVVVLLGAGLIIMLVAFLAGGGGGGGGGGDEVGSGGGGGGGGLNNPPIIPFVPPVIPSGPIPTNPEPSTFLLLGLGLLAPFFRRFKR